MGDQDGGAFDFSQLVPEEFRLPKRPGYDEILAEARRLAAVHGEHLTLPVFLAETRVQRRDITLWFVTWGRLRMAAGLRSWPTKRKTGPPAGEMTEAMRRMAEEEGPDVTQVNFCKRTGWSPSLVLNRFGSYAALRESAGLPPQPRRKKVVTRARVVADLADVWEELGRPEPFMRIHDYTRLGRFSTYPVYERLGSWKAAAAAVREYLAAEDKGADSGGVAAGDPREA